jgi:ribonuclease D
MVTPLLTPRGGMPQLVESETDFKKTISELTKGSGDIAIDAERASGYRYSQRAYLIQIFRSGGGLHLIDPIPLVNSKLWQEFNNKFSKFQWVIHASTQDLPCLIGVGLKPKLLFDTELGARIAGCERVGLGSLAESLLEIQLAKEHSAVDWSIRPLKSEWLTYAALDVDILLDIKDQVEKLLIAQSKLTWAQQEFSSILDSYSNYKFSDEPKADRWRRTSGMHKVRDRLTLTIVRDLWLSRNELAAELDIAPGRVLGDQAIIELALNRPDNLEEVAKIIGWRTKLEAPPFGRWLRTLTNSLSTAIEDQPEYKVASQNLPPTRVWKDKNPLGYARLTHARALLAELSTQLKIPIENIITPEFIRRICWQEPPKSKSDYQAFLENELIKYGARNWQIEQVVAPMEVAIDQIEPLIVAELDDGEVPKATTEEIE